MDDFTKNLGIGGGSGLIGIILGWLGFKGQMKEIKSDLEGVKRRVQFRDTCDQIVKRLESTMKRIEGMQDEMRKDIKKLLIVQAE